jgi:hypothetical protein
MIATKNRCLTQEWGVHFPFRLTSTWYHPLSLIALSKHDGLLRLTRAFPCFADSIEVAFVVVCQGLLHQAGYRQGHAHEPS